jgi:membrane protein DedA with SNARE-associated domain
VPGTDLLYELLAAFLLLVSAALGNPIPEEVMIAGAGVWTASNAEKYGAYRWLMLPVCVAGAVVADVGLYLIGRVFGTRLLEHRWLARLAPPEKRERTQQNFNRYGVSILVFGRLVPGIRTTLFLTAGLMRLSLVRFVLADGLGAVLGNSLIFFLGFWFGSQFLELVERLERQASAVKPILILLLLVAVTGYLLYLFLRRPIPTGDPKELPLIGPQVAAHLPTKPASEASTGPPADAAPPKEGVQATPETQP